MKIKSLYISEFKTIKEQTFHFTDSLISLFVGQNGLGKSNLFEAISIIFEHVERSKSNSELNNTKPSFDFAIEFECQDKFTFLTSNNDEYKISIKNSLNDEYKPISFSTFKPIRNQYLPKLIIAYYSGENKRVQAHYFGHKTRWEYNLRKNSPSIETPLLGGMFFTEQNFGELIFLTLWVFKDSIKYGKLIHELLEMLIGIELDTNVSVLLQNPVFSKNFPEKNVDNLIDNLYEEESEPLWGLKGRVNEFINILIENSNSLPIAYFDDEKGLKSHIKEFVDFNTIDFNKLSNNIYNSFESPAELLDVLVACNHLNIIYDIKSIISKNGQSINHSFNELSEGEQQLLTVIGLALITGEFDTLFLLDEPDTHLNPMWQRKFVKLLEDFNLKDSNSHFLVATHSPLIVQSSEKADVFLFKKDGEEIIIDSGDHQIHNWRIDQVLTSEYFDFDSARPPSLDQYMFLKEKIINKYPFDANDELELKQFENEFGVLPTGETKTEIKALQLMNKLINSTNDKD